MLDNCSIVTAGPVCKANHANEIVPIMNGYTQKRRQKKMLMGTTCVPCIII